MHPSSSFLLFILVSFFPRSFDSQGDKYYRKCEPQRFPCGNFLDNISYPFLASDRSADCGHQEYTLTCRNESPEIQIGSKTYRVIDGIDYENQLLSIVENQYAEHDYCPIPSGDDSLPQPPLFLLSDAVLTVSLCYNCSEAIKEAFPGRLEEVPCLQASQGHPACYTRTPITDVIQQCQARVLPVLIKDFQRLSSNSIYMEDVVKNGFQVRWLEGDPWCAACRSAGGRCGRHQVNRSEPACFCPDQSQYPHCLRDVPVAGKRKNSSHAVILIVVPTTGIAAGVAIVSMIYLTKKKQKNTVDKSEVEDVESMKFSLASIRAATDDFSEAHKVGEGGFGAVYKGRLPDGQEVAVKETIMAVGHFLLRTFQISFLCSLLLLLMFGLTSAQEQEYVHHICTGLSNFTGNSTFQTNLNLLLPALSSNASRTGFYNTTIGRSPDRIHGLVLCRAYISAMSCDACVNVASENVTQSCPRSKGAAIWYDLCFLRYSDQDFFSSMDDSRWVYLLNSQNATNPTFFNQLLGNISNNLVSQAVDDPSGRLAAGGVVGFNDVQTFYGLVQCTRDLSRDDCRECLQTAVRQIPICCYRKEGVKYMGLSCQLRYGVYGMLEGSQVAPPAPPRSPPLPTLPGEGEKNSSRTVILIVVPIVGIIAAVVIISAIYVCLPRKAASGAADESEIMDVESLKYSLASIRVATDHFSEDNKLGEGGFGSVYKGRLPDGQEVAVKRLSGHSKQGSQEFKNEVALIAKLQHRNLVRLLGWCLQGDENILIYEFVPNKSLDKFLFGPVKQAQLDWPRRYQIIEGIVRGLLYLHEDSRLRVVHRDLKSGNVLLDAAMNPKISDFGLARIFAAEQSHGNTNRIAGTYGYMAPEYAMRGLFSVKSDVYSFGVLVLEIITGRKNIFLIDSGEVEDLPSHAWRHWKNRTVVEMVDPAVRESCSANEVIRCVHIALLCVQDDAAKRPYMSSVALILKSHSVTLPFPSQPTFFPSGADSEHDLSRGGQWPLSANDLSITDLIPR